LLPRVDAQYATQAKSIGERGFMRRKTTFQSCLVVLFLLTAIGAWAGDKADVKGMITNRTGETLIVKGDAGTTTIVLTDDTITKDDRGLFGLEKEHMSSVVLIPGLKVDIDGTTDDQGRVVAKKITVDGDDLETAEMIQSGLTPTAEQVAKNVQTLETHQGQLEGHQVQLAAHKENIEENEQNIARNRQRIAENEKDIQENTNRFLALSEYDVKSLAVVKFDVGSSKLSANGKNDLNSLAQVASGLKGYIVEVVGYADATGSAEVNTKLSEDRAKAVVTYLMQQGGVPVRHIVAPGAMGEYGPAASNETKTGRADNRRVEVKVLVNKGITGS
jgi:outer membrane protein OmpA-like peptidoglycan-associated protein